LLDAGASPNTGWIEMIDHPNPRPLFEAVIYGAAAIAQHAELTRLLLERGADPNDEETAYHVVETRDNTVLKILLESGKLNERSGARCFCGNVIGMMGRAFVLSLSMQAIRTGWKFGEEQRCIRLCFETIAWK
jgi:hypothetical protein